MFENNQWFWMIVMVGAMGLAVRSIVRRIAHVRAQRLGIASRSSSGSGGGSGARVVSMSNEKKRGDGTLAAATLTYGNGNVYTGELSAAHLFDGVGAFQYKLTRGALLQRTPAELAARRSAILSLFDAHRSRHAATAERLERLFRSRLWRSELDALSLNGHAPFVGYAGEFRDGFQHGVGREFTHNDQAYEGAFVDGKRHGHGTLVYAAGAQGVYVGQFVDDKKHDDAASFFFGPAVDGPLVLPHNALNNAVYTGAFRNGQRHGRGVLRKPNGDEIEMFFYEGTVQSAIPKDADDAAAAAAADAKKSE